MSRIAYVGGQYVPHRSAAYAFLKSANSRTVALPSRRSPDRYLAHMAAA